MMKCEIIRDLIPLYLDKVCSEDSRKLVEEHLAECSECRKYIKISSTLTSQIFAIFNASVTDGE